MSIELITKPINYSFKAIFFNPNGDPAQINNAALEAGESDISFNGINDLSEYIGATNVLAVNTNFNGDAVPTSEVVLT